MKISPEAWIRLEGRPPPVNPERMPDTHGDVHAGGDRLVEIDYTDYEVTEDDVQWLIAEIKRLRAEIEQWVNMVYGPKE